MFKRFKSEKEWERERERGRTPSQGNYSLSLLSSLFLLLIGDLPYSSFQCVPFLSSVILFSRIVKLSLRRSVNKLTISPVLKYSRLLHTPKINTLLSSRISKR